MVGFIESIWHKYRSKALEGMPVAEVMYGGLRAAYPCKQA
jgi:hypothetical protein